MAQGAGPAHSDPDGLLRRLQEQFSPDDLGKAGVLVPAGNGATGDRLHEELASKNRTIYRDAPENSRPFDLLTACGSLRHPYACGRALLRSPLSAMPKPYGNDVFRVFHRADDHVSFARTGGDSRDRIGSIAWAEPGRVQGLLHPGPASKMHHAACERVLLVGWWFAEPKGAHLALRPSLVTCKSCTCILGSAA